jgi:hypothetical protein
MRRFAFILTFAPAVFAASATEPKDISQAGIQTAFRILQKEYIRSSDLTFEVLNRAALFPDCSNASTSAPNSCHAPARPNPAR